MISRKRRRMMLRMTMFRMMLRRRRRTDPRTLGHTLREPVQPKCTLTFHKSQ